MSHWPSCRCRKLPKALKDWQAFNDLKQKIEDFNETCPLLEMMANKAMKDRHWERIAQTTSHPFDVESENFQLRNIMEAPLLKCKEDIEVRHFNLISNLMLMFFACIKECPALFWKKSVYVCK